MKWPPAVDETGGKLIISQVSLNHVWEEPPWDNAAELAPCLLALG